MVPGFWFPVSSFRFADFGFWFLVSGFRLLISGFWFLVSGFWFPVSGFWLGIFGLGFLDWDLGLGELGWRGRGNPWAVAGGTRPGASQYRFFKKLDKNPLEIPKGIPS